MWLLTRRIWKRPQFKKYQTVTQGMVKSLRLVETDPIILGSKGK
jgi:hypothetical protein